MDASQKYQSVNEHISVSAQLSSEQFEQLPQQNFQSVLNLRSYEEKGADQQDRQRVESYGLTYANLPVKPAELDVAVIDDAVQKIQSLPKPLLIYCGSAMRATFMALMYLANEQSITVEEIQSKGRSLGFDFEDKPSFNQPMETYVRSTAK